jgi:hypothetical protein
MYGPEVWRAEVGVEWSYWDLCAPRDPDDRPGLRSWSFDCP